MLRCLFSSIMDRLQKISNIIFLLGILLAFVQVVLIGFLDKYNNSLSRIDKSITSISQELVSLDNFILLYKSPMLLSNSVKIYKPKVIYINPNLSNKILSYEYSRKH